MEDDKLFTTNAQDVQNVANLQARLATSSASHNKDGSTTITYDIPAGSTNKGSHKSILIIALPPTHGSANRDR